MPSKNLKSGQDANPGCFSYLATLIIIFFIFQAIMGTEKAQEITTLLGITMIIGVPIAKVLFRKNKSKSTSPNLPFNKVKTTPDIKPLAGPNLETTLRNYYVVNNFSELLKSLHNELPKWRLSSTIIQVVENLKLLNDVIRTAKEKGIEVGLALKFEEEAQRGADVLWSLTDRIAPFKTHLDPILILQPIQLDVMKEQNTKIYILGLAVKESYNTLISVVITGSNISSEIQAARNKLQSLNEAVTELYFTTQQTQWNKLITGQVQ